MEEITTIRAEERAKAAAIHREGPQYVLQAAVMGDPEAAATLLTDLIDSGHDGALVSSPVGDSVLYEIHLGPFDTLEQANAVGEAVRKSHGLAPAILVLEGEKGDEKP